METTYTPTCTFIMSEPIMQYDMVYIHIWTCMFKGQSRLYLTIYFIFILYKHSSSVLQVWDLVKTCICEATSKVNVKCSTVA